MVKEKLMVKKGPLPMEKNQESGILLHLHPQTEWLIPAFLDSYFTYNDFPIHILDSGVSANSLSKYKTKSLSVVETKLLPFQEFILHPHMLLLSPFTHTLWITPNCEIQGNVQPFFSLLSSSQEAFFCHRKTATKISIDPHCVVFKKDSSLLKEWKESMKENPKKDTFLSLLLSRNPLSWGKIPPELFHTHPERKKKTVIYSLPLSLGKIALPVSLPSVASSLPSPLDPVN